MDEETKRELIALKYKAQDIVSAIDWIVANK